MKEEGRGIFPSWTPSRDPLDDEEKEVPRNNIQGHVPSEK